jgi:hypothetical protein
VLIRPDSNGSSDCLKSEIFFGSGRYRERFYERAVKRKVFSMPPTVLGS